MINFGQQLIYVTVRSYLVDEFFVKPVEILTLLHYRQITIIIINYQNLFLLINGISQIRALVIH